LFVKKFVRFSGLTTVLVKATDEANIAIPPSVLELD